MVSVIMIYMKIKYNIMVNQQLENLKNYVAYLTVLSHGAKIMGYRI